MDVGGMENVVLNLTRGLERCGVESFVGCLLHGGVWAGEGRVTDVWHGRRGERSGPAVLFSLCRYLKRKRISLIHSHNSYAHIFAFAASILTGIPLVHTKHGRNWPDNPKWVWLSRQMSRFTRRVIPVSEDIARIVRDVEKVPVSKVVKILNGVDTEVFCPITERPTTNAQQPTPKLEDSHVGRGTLDVGRWALDSPIARLRDERGIPADAFVVGSVGRFSPEKQYPFLVTACARFVREAGSGKRKAESGMEGGEPWLVIVGDGREKQAVETTADRLGVKDRVILPGVRDDVVDWLRCMDVFCLSSDQEGTSITLLEAGATGIPSVVTDVGGNAEIVKDGATGIVVPFGDEAALAGAFERLSTDEELRSMMGKESRERVKAHYSLEKMVDDYAAVYREVARTA